MKHTPGPWYPVNYGGFVNLQQEDFYSEKDNLLDMECCEKAEANGILAAAAPELLKALEMVSDYMKNNYAYVPPFMVVNFTPIMEEAIKKATEK